MVEADLDEMPKCLDRQAACRDFGGDLSWHGQCPKLIVGYLYVPEAWVTSESAGRRLNEERYSSPALERNTHRSHQMPYLLPAMPGDGLSLAVHVGLMGLLPPQGSSQEFPSALSIGRSDYQ